MSITEIRSALNAEIDATPKQLLFKIVKISPYRPGLLIDLQFIATHGIRSIVLDDSFLGTLASWSSPVHGEGAVMEVFPNTNQIVLGDFNGAWPHPDQVISLPSFNYIRPVLNCWNDEAWATQAYDCLKDLVSPKLIPSAPLSGNHFTWLRLAQRASLSLVNYSSSFLWGPPGTGKTTTIGVLVAEFLFSNPQAKVLLLSTTNRAVDQALIAIDKALSYSHRHALRHAMRRTGNGYDVHHYRGRQHLLGNCANEMLHEGAINEPLHVSNESPTEIRLMAMTIASAISSMATLRKNPTFDLVVFDEASQIGLAQTLAVMPLGKARLLAGDPNQLSPIARDRSPSVRRWLIPSTFSLMPSAGPSVCMLNEQSRMIGPICYIIIQIFYGENLKVATDALNNQEWLNDRKFQFANIPPKQHVAILPVCSNHEQNRPMERSESAELIVKLVLSALFQQHVKQGEVVIVTPFRKQCALLRSLLGQYHLNEVRVCTANSMQGAEASVIIFDPVDGLNDFLMKGTFRQLINVALSRAKAKLILTLSAKDLTNPLFAQMQKIVQKHANRAIKPLHLVLDNPKYITTAVGERVVIDNQVCEITRFSSCGREMWVVVEATSQEVLIDARKMRQIACAKC